MKDWKKFIKNLYPELKEKEINELESFFNEENYNKTLEEIDMFINNLHKTWNYLVKNEWTNVFAIFVQPFFDGLLETNNRLVLNLFNMDQ